MNPLPKGNYALCIAHPGHELRLHGFLEQAKPFVFILTDGSHRAEKDLMMDSIRCIDRATKFGMKKNMAYSASDKSKKIFKFSDHSADEGQEHLKDALIYAEIVNQWTGVFEAFTRSMINNLVKYKIDYLVADASEGHNVCHEMMRIMADVAIEVVKKKTGHEILNYDFAIEKPYNENITDAIHIELDPAAVDRKLDAIVNFPLAPMDLRPNISLDYSLIVELEKMKEGKAALKEMIRDVNPGFLQNEYLRPYTASEPSGKPIYEIEGEKAVAAEKYVDVITYKDHLKPLKEKILKLILEPTHVKIGD